MITGKSKVIRKDINLSRILKNIDDMDHVKSKVGFPKEASVKGQTRKGSGRAPFNDMSEVATIAIYNEYGTKDKKTGSKRIPPRPALQTSFVSNRSGIKDRLKKEARRVVLGKQDALMGIGRVGAWLTAQTKLTYRNWTSPSNAESTKRQKKGVNNPLVDTGQMVNTITHSEVR